MNRLFIALVAVLFASHIYADDSDSCIDTDIAREANYHLEVDPITAKLILSSVPDCDDKFALMHKANVKIAERCREEFYYQNKINPHGWYDFQTPNMYENHVMENPDQFRSAQEGYSIITANDYWIKKITNRFEFHERLHANHCKPDEPWVGYYKKATGIASIIWTESVDEALCYGWIDGLRKSLDEESYCIRFTPRKAGINWSAVNIQRARELIKLGR